MYTLDLREVKLTPTLSEDKKFENEDSWALREEAVAYIAARYGETYNPVTVERHVKNAIRDAEGKTNQDRYDEKDAASMALIMEDRAKRQPLADAVHEEYASKNADLKTWFSAEAAKIADEYFDKIAAANPEDAETLREEQQVKLDELSLAFRKKSEAQWDEESTKTDEIWKS